MPYPTALDAFTNPTGSDRLSSPSHSSQHADVNDAVEAIEARLGTGSQTTPGAASRVFRSTSASASEWASLALGTDVSGTLAIVNGGTGQSNITEAFDALAPTTTAGDIIYRTSTDNVRLAIGSATTVLHGGASAPAYSAVALGVDVSGTLAIVSGGTGQSNITEAFDALSPTTTRGDMIYRGASDNLRLAVGGAGKIIRSDGTDPVYSTATYPNTAAVSTILYASATDTIAALATANSGVLVTSGTGVPSIGTDIPTAVTIGGGAIYRVGGTDVAVADGGTGVGSWTNGQLLIGNTTGNTAALATLTGTANQITVTNGASSITLATPQSIATTSTPQFLRLGIGVAADGTIPFTTTTGIYAINDTSNGNMTTGITINQGAADDVIFALKSSDVAHPMTTNQESDTYGSFEKVQATSGGLLITGWKDADGSNALALTMRGCLGEAADTTKTTAALGIVNLEAAITNGATGIADPGVDANLVTIRLGASGTVRFIFDTEGSAHADIEWVAFDSHDDVALLDTFDTKMTKRDALTNSFGEFLKYNQKDLQEAKIVNFYDDGPRAMVNLTRMHMLEVGAIRQLAYKIKQLELQLQLKGVV